MQLGHPEASRVPIAPANRSESASYLSLDGWCGERKGEAEGSGGRGMRQHLHALWFCGPASLCNAQHYWAWSAQPHEHSGPPAAEIPLPSPSLPFL